MSQGVRPNDRILLRDRPWLVRRVTGTADDRHLIELEPLDGEHPPSLTVAVPPEEFQALPGEAVSFDLHQLESLAAWSRTHRILGATIVRESGLLTGARFGRVALEAYQLAPTLRILAKPRPSLLVADDVGLGKTIEAGLAMLELMARRRVERILIVTPPGLMDQWYQELLDKFGLAFKIIDNASGLAQVQTELPAGVSPWDALTRVITSIDFIKKETVRNRALRKRWDLVIVDEAHALAESGTPDNPYRTQRTRLGRALRDASRGLLLLTATPHNGYAHAFRSLIELVEPTLASFRGSAQDLERRVETARIRRMKSQIRRRLPDGREEEVFPQRVVSGIPVRLHDEEERQLLRKVASYCSQTAKRAAETEDAELVGFAMQIVKKRALSSRAALAKTLENRVEALKKEEAQEEPPSRSDLRDYQANLPQPESATERTARRILRSAIPKEEKRRKAEIRALNGIRRLLKKLPENDPKIETLLGELKSVFEEDPTEKAIVFTEYRDSLNAVCTRLERDADLSGRYVVLTGGLTRRQRLRRQDAFARPETRLLLATDAASEGLNLQHHCRRVIHLELPWNPNRLEQRNGRVDRYGQTRNPIIRYLYYPDSPEEDVLTRLIEKIEQMARDRVSTPDILGVLVGKGEMEQGLVELDPESPDVGAGKASLVRIFEDRTRDFVRSVQPLLTGSPSTSESEHARILKLLDTTDPLLPDDLELERIALDMLGPAAVPDPQREAVYRIHVPLAYRGDGVCPVYPAATFRRSIAVRYRADEIDYLTPLHPLIRALAADARRRLLQVYPTVRGLPPRRLAARRMPPGEPPSVVFTFFGSIQGGGCLLEEHLLVARVDTEGNILGDPGENLHLLEDGNAGGEVARHELESLFARRFEAMRERAEEEVRRWLEDRAAALRKRRQEQAEVLRNNLQVDVADRLREIDEEEKHARGLIKDSGQMLLFGNGNSARGGFTARRQAVESYKEHRLEEISTFEQVDQPSPPRPLGALFLVPGEDKT